MAIVVVDASVLLHVCCRAVLRVPSTYGADDHRERKRRIQRYVPTPFPTSIFTLFREP